MHLLAVADLFQQPICVHKREVEHPRGQLRFVGSETDIFDSGYVEAQREDTEGVNVTFGWYKASANVVIGQLLASNTTSGIYISYGEGEQEM